MQISRKNQSDKKNQYLELYVIDDYTERYSVEHQRIKALTKEDFYRYFNLPQPKESSTKKRIPNKRIVKKGTR